MDYKIKQKPEDFLVDEIPAAADEGKGEYSYFLMEKKDCNTLKAVKLVSGQFRIGLKRFGWAGNKDKNAVTKQLISIQNAGRGEEGLKLDNIKLSYYGRGTQRIYLGNLLGNAFAITLRNLTGSGCETISRNAETLKSNGFMIPNYFDEQRFGGENVEVGRAMLERRFEEAASRIYRKSTTNPVAALRNVHNSALSMHIHAYQSLIFNEALSEYITMHSGNNREAAYSKGKFIFPLKKINNSRIPIIGFATELGSSETEEIARKVMERHGVTQRDFVFRQIPGLSIEGDSRDAFTQVKGLSMGRPEEDELNHGRKKLAVRFSLDKGSYATIALKALTC